MTQKTTPNKGIRRQRLITTDELVQDDQYGVSTPTFLPAGGDDVLVDDAGMAYFPEEFSGCNDNGDSDDFRNDEVGFSPRQPLQADVSSRPAVRLCRESIASTKPGEAGTRRVRTCSTATVCPSMT